MNFAVFHGDPSNRYVTSACNGSLGNGKTFGPRLTTRVGNIFSMFRYPTRCCGGVQKRNPVGGGKASSPIAADETATPQMIMTRNSFAPIAGDLWLNTSTLPVFGMADVAAIAKIID